MQIFLTKMYFTPPLVGFMSNIVNIAGRSSLSNSRGIEIKH